MKKGHTCVQCERTETSQWFWVKKGTPTCSSCYMKWYRKNRPEQYKLTTQKQNRRPEAKERRKKYEKSEAGRKARSKYNASEKGLRSKRKWDRSPQGKLRKYIKTAERRYKKAQATPKWIKGELKESINKKYEEAHTKSSDKEKYVVDHIIPINNNSVSGLHVPWNLQVITETENSRKLNRFDGTYDNESWRQDYDEYKEGELS